MNIVIKNFIDIYSINTIHKIQHKYFILVVIKIDFFNYEFQLFITESICNITPYFYKFINCFHHLFFKYLKTQIIFLIKR